jgi:hypothetical protein
MSGMGRCQALGQDVCNGWKADTRPCGYLTLLASKPLANSLELLERMVKVETRLDAMDKTRYE